MEASDSQLIRDNTWDWYTCFHPETEILTYDGWKPVSEVALREAVATMDMSSGEMYYMPAVEVQSYDFDGELVDVWQRSGVSYRVTPNHNLHIASSKTGPIRTVRADETPETFYIPRSAKVFLGGTPPARTGFRAQHGNGKDFSCATTTWFKFFGAWLGDGSIYAPRGQVVLSAIKPRKRKFFTKVLSEMGVTFWEQERKVTFQNVEVARYLERFGGSHEKYIPENMKHAATPYLEALLEGLFETDGHVVDVDRRYRYVTTSKQLADDVMELAVKCGYAVSYSVRPIDTYHLSLRKTYMTQVDARVRGKTSAPVRKMVPYKGKVHCVTVPPHHSVLIRDRGRISWSGQSTAYTRLAPGGGVLGIMTLWNDDDWGGRTITYSENGEGDKFEIVRYPAINEGYDEYQENETFSIVKKYPADPVPDNATLIRKADSALHPDRYDTEMLLKIKRNLYASGQQRVWSALYQQNPAPEEGAYFTKDLFRYYSTPPRRRGNFIYQAWDFAIAEGQENDYTVGATILQDERDALHVLDIRRFKSADSLYIVDVILDYAAEHDADLLGFEDGQIWKTMQAQFDKRCEERRMYPTYEILKPLTDKKARANPLKGRMQAGKVYFPDKAPWFHDLYSELLRFPAGKHDDQIDALAWAVRLTLTRSAPKVKEPDRIKSWKDKLSTGGSLGDVSHMAA
jgi:predicted phage terminase large subunit-like protein